MRRVIGMGLGPVVGARLATSLGYEKFLIVLPIDGLIHTALMIFVARLSTRREKEQALESELVVGAV